MQDFFKADNIPTLMIFFGGILAIFGAFLFNNKNSRSTRLLLNKAETSIEKSENAINHITGGDSWCYFQVSLNKVMRKDGELIKQIASLQLEHDGVYPIPEIQARVYELIPNKENPNSHQMIVIFEKKLTWIGQLGYNEIELIDIDLEGNEDTKRYEVNIGAPNGVIHQEIIFKKDDTGIWHHATKVERIVITKTPPDQMNRRTKSGKPEKLYQYIADKFPEKEKLNWKDK